MMISWKKILLGAAALAATLGAVNYVRLYQPAQAALKNTDTIIVASYYRFGVIPDAIVFNLRNVGPDASTASILGRFFSFADELKDREFREVRLAYKGQTKFILDGVLDVTEN